MDRTVPKATGRSLVHSSLVWTSRIRSPAGRSPSAPYAGAGHLEALLIQLGLHPPPVGGRHDSGRVFEVGEVVVDGLALLAGVGGGLVMVSAWSQRSVVRVS
jgi:hypothetical protein